MWHNDLVEKYIFVRFPAASTPARELMMSTARRYPRRRDRADPVQLLLAGRSDRRVSLVGQWKNSSRAMGYGWRAAFEVVEAFEVVNGRSAVDAES
jgi:hypothetical protein